MYIQTLYTWANEINPPTFRIIFGEIGALSLTQTSMYWYADFI